jgi:putative membrane protein
MVIYNNKEWFKLLINFYRSYVMQRLVRFALWAGLLTSALCIVILEVLRVNIRFHSGTFSLLGIVLSILLVFRTNTAYDRWWEGRRQWGSLVNTSRNIALSVHGLLPRNDLPNRSFYAKHISNFAIALKEHLRGGVKLDELHDLTETELQVFAVRQHLPNYLIGMLYERTQELYRSDLISGYDLIALKTHIGSLADILGACERIKKTPIPFSYSIYIKTLILAYAVLLPFGLIEEFGYFTIPIVMLIFFAFLGLELLAQEIEDPFGLDCNDLPTGNIAQTIKNNVYEVVCLFAQVQQEAQQQEFQKVF